MKKGIDVSKHQGAIKWDKAAKVIDFAIIRASYGTNKDEMFDKNAVGCAENDVPFGLYVASYAVNAYEAIEEAKFVCALANKYSVYSVPLPVFFDWEYFSYNYAVSKGYKPTAEMIKIITNNFCSQVKEEGYTPGIYTNLDYYNKYYKDIIQQHALWFAHWVPNAELPPNTLFWQYTSKGICAGIEGFVDFNYMIDEEYKNENLENVLKKWNSLYINLAKEVISGKWGNGTDRILNVKKAGYDYKMLQAIVNEMVK